MPDFTLRGGYLNRKRNSIVFSAILMTSTAAVLSYVLWLAPNGRQYPVSAPVSYATVQHVNHMSNFLIYSFAVLVCLLIGAISLTFRKRVGFLRFRPPMGASRLLLLTIALLILGTVGFTSQFFHTISGTPSASREPFSAPLIDTFHEGEVLSSIPYLLNGDLGAKPLLAHGLGMDLLPGLFAIQLFPSHHRIVGARIGTALLTLAAFFAFVFAGYQVFLSLYPHRTSIDLFLCFSFLLWNLILYDLLCIGSPRRLILYLQVALTFKIARSGARSDIYHHLVAFLLGLTIPLGLLYNYGIGAIGFALILLGSVLFCLRQPVVLAKKHLAAVGLGAFTSLLITCFLLGSSWLSTAAVNVVYWFRYGQLLTFTPMFRREWLGKPEWYFYSILLIVAPAFAGATVVSDYLSTRRWRPTIQRRHIEVLLLALCVLDARTFLERADFQHFGFAAPSFVLVSGALLIGALRSPITDFLRRWRPATRIFACAFVLFSVFTVALPHLRPGAIANKASDLKSSWQKQDSQILRPDYLAAMNGMKSQLVGQSCFFTMNSEGAWYYLVGKPSCSPFAQLNYARTIEAQDRVVSDLRRLRPKVILVKGEVRDGTFDNITVEKYAPNVWAYVSGAYLPSRTVEGFHFYELR